MFARVVINIEAPLADSFHYFVPGDLRSSLAVGHLVEVEFGRRLAQAIVIALEDQAPVEETKPIIGIIDDVPVVKWWQIDLAIWLSEHYLAPLNSCLRLMLPPGLTRWSDSVYDVNPYWSGEGRLTELQAALLEELRLRGPLRTRGISRAFGKKSNWKQAADQLVRRDIVRRASVLDPPRIRPKQIRYAELTADFLRQVEAVSGLGRRSKPADILFYLLRCEDPFPVEEVVIDATGTKVMHVDDLVAQGLIFRNPALSLVVPLVPDIEFPGQFSAVFELLPAPRSDLGDSVNALLQLDLVRIEEQAATIGLVKTDQDTFAEAMRLRQA